jgi:hypothetical protein
MRSLPVSLVTLDDVRYIVSDEGLAWVANAQVAGWAVALAFAPSGSPWYTVSAGSMDAMAPIVELLADR